MANESSDPRPRVSEPFNVLGAFPTEQGARKAARRLAAGGIPASGIHLPTRGENGRDQVAETRAEMQDEITGSWPAPSFIMTGSQTRGALVGTLIAVGIGAVAGLLAGLAWAYWFDSELRPGVRVGLGVGLGVVAMATAGFIAGGGIQPRREGASDSELPLDDHRTAGERMFLVAVHSGDESMVERARLLLAEAGAARIDLVDATGTPLPSQADNPRPADPPGYWWTRAGEG